MKKLILIALTVLINNIYSCSQTNYTFDVNGIEIGKYYTDGQMRAKLGEPNKFHTQPGDWKGESREYQYKTNGGSAVFRYSDEYDGFNSFGISTPNFKLFNGNLKVGDNISKVAQLGLGIPIKQSNGEYDLYMGDDPLIFTVNSINNITVMSYTMSM